MSVKIYSFHSRGSIYFFKPEKPAYDVRIQKKQTALEFHISLVKEANDPSVFICDDHGLMIHKSNKPVSHVPMEKWNALKENKKKNKN